MTQFEELVASTMIIVLVPALFTLQSAISPVGADCPKLPSIPLTRPVYSWCTTQSHGVNRTCIFVCVDGYSLENDRNRVSFQFMCQANGTWSGKIHKCVDTRRPDLHCPDDITIVARKGSPSEVASWKIDVDDNSIPVDPNAKVTLHSTHESPHNFTIGRHEVYVTATDKAGNKATCLFHVLIRDLELPTCSFCPGDIVRVGKSPFVRVPWDRPVCSDNSHLPPKITANRQNGDLFGVPGTYKIQYTVEDHAYPRSNIYTGCSFNIILKRAKCPLYPPPKNGALVCLNYADGSPSLCQVACQTGTDFDFDPPLIYFCDITGTWQTSSPFRHHRPPWPSCTSGAAPSVVTNFGLSSYFLFNGNQEHSKVVADLKQNFLTLIKSRYVPPWFCQMNRPCPSDKLHVYV